ncbi:HD domain-containing phosphohydrolase [Pseudoduganella danionis]|uniref:HD domain-containing phosphohydrolase n=1 Tax=Pseudoduganella danionis TaxID=1890295 RepID=UPI0035AD7E79
MKSIRFRLLALMCAIFLVVSTALVISAVERRHSDVQNARQQLQLLSKAIAKEQVESVRKAHTLSSQIGSDPALIHFAKSATCPRTLKTLVDFDPNFANIFIANLAGEVICSARPSGEPINISDRDFFRAALESDEAVIGQPVIGKFTRKWVLPFAHRFNNPAHKTEGIIVTALDLERINRESLALLFPNGTNVALVTEAGTVVANFPVYTLRAGRIASREPDFVQLLRQGGKGDAILDNELGESTLHSYAPVTRTASGAVYWWASIPLPLITQSADRQLLIYSAPVVLLGALILVFAWYGTEHYLLGPLRSISQTAEGLGKGQTVNNPELARRDDEIGVLARTISQMAISLESKSEIVRLNRALQVLIECGRTISSSETEKSLLSRVCETLVRVGGYRMVWIGYCDFDDGKQVRPVAFGGHNNGYLEGIKVSWADDEYGQGPTGAAIRLRQAQFNRDFKSNPAVAPWSKMAIDHQFSSSSALPLIEENGDAFGALTIYSSSKDHFTPHEMQLLSDLASDISFGIRALRNRETRDGFAVRLGLSLEATVRAIASTLEMRDPYTGGHQRKVASLAEAIARELGLPATEIQGIVLAAEVHDIGKIRIPAEILTKPTRLTELERGMLQTHPDTGYEILKGIDFTWPIAEMVRQHHERIDGTGYPRGLKGEQILIGARIIAVADVIDAMASHRPYRSALGINAALEELRKGRGRQYDESVVDACIKVITKGEIKI